MEGSVIENARGNDSQSVTLYILPYRVTVSAVNILTSVFEIVTYTCDAEGFPPLGGKCLMKEKIQRHL